MSKSSGLVNVSLRVNDGASSSSHKSISVESDWSNLTFKYKAEPVWDDSSNIQGAVRTWTDLNYFDGMSLGFFTPGQWVFSIQMLNDGTAVYEGSSDVITISTSDVDVTVPVSKLSSPDLDDGIIDVVITAPTIANDDALTISWGDLPGDKYVASGEAAGSITTFTFRRSFAVDSYTFKFTHSKDDRGAAVAIDLHQGEVVKIRGQLENGKWQIGSVTMQVHTITVERFNHATPPAIKYCGTVDIDIDSAVPGDRVSFSANPATGSSVDSASVSLNSGGEIDLEDVDHNNHLYSFIMPDGDVTINVKFMAVEPTEINTKLFKTFVQAFYNENDGNVQFFGKASGSPGTGMRSISLGDVQLWYDSSAHKICWYSNVDVVKLSPGSLMSLFKDCVTYKSIDMDGIVTSAITDMAGMFQGCSGLTTLNLGSFDASSATDISNMFQGCANLQNITVSAFNTNTSSDVNMAGLFKDCAQLNKINDNNFALPNGFNTSRATNLAGMFQGCSRLTTLNLGSFDASSATDISNMFQGCASLANITVSAFNTNISSGVNMAGLFKDCAQLNKINDNNFALPNGFNTSRATNLAGMFQGCAALNSLNLANFNAGSAIDVSSMFQDCTGLQTLTLTGFTINSTNSVKMKEMFKNCSNLTSLNLSSFNTSKATDMSGMFCGCLNLAGTLNLSNFNTAEVTDMSYMFCGCRTLTGINFGNNFITSKVTDMAYMFSSNELSIEHPPAMNLTSLDVRGFDTSKVGTGDPANPGSLRNMFYMCYKLTQLDVSGFRTPHVQDMSYMFACYQGQPSGLTALDLSEWDFTNVKTIRNMFDRCQNLNTGLKFPGETDGNKKTNFASLTNMSFLFSQCLALTPKKFASIVSTWTFADNPNDIYGQNANSLFGNTDTSRDKGGNYIFRDSMTNTGGKFESRSPVDPDTGTPIIYRTKDGNQLWIGGGETVSHGRLTVYQDLP